MKKTPIGIKLISVALIFGNIIYLLTELSMLSIEPRHVYNCISIFAAAPSCAYFHSIFMIFLNLLGLNLVWGVSVVAVGVGLFFKKEIARKVLVFLLILYVGIDIIYMGVVMFLSNMTSYGFINLFQISVPIFYVVYLTRSNIKKFFQ